MLPWFPIVIAAVLSTPAFSPPPGGARETPTRTEGGRTRHAQPACRSSWTSALGWTALGAGTGALVGWAAHGRGSKASTTLYVGVGAVIGGGLGFATDYACDGEEAGKRGLGEEGSVGPREKYSHAITTYHAAPTNSTAAPTATTEPTK